MVITEKVKTVLEKQIIINDLVKGNLVHVVYGDAIILIFDDDRFAYYTWYACSSSKPISNC